MKFIIIFLVLCFLACASAQLKNFTNPIFDTSGMEPSVLKLGNDYFITFSGNQGTEIHIYKSPYLTSFRYIEKKVLYRVNVGYSELVAPRLQNIDDQLYIYFAMRNETVSHKMYAMKALDPTNPLGKWSTPKRLLENMWGLAAFHGTVLNHNGRQFFVWTSPQAVATTRDIHIAAMTNPMEVIEPIVLLKHPAEPWECLGYCSNEAPSFIYKNGTAYLVYSASSRENPDHSLSYMSIDAGRDPMNPSNWSFATGPVFVKSEEQDVYAPGHSSFTTSPDGTETWMVYHASATNTDIPGSRTVRLERITWDEELQTPIFPTTHGYAISQPRPSGEPEMFTNPVLDVPSANPSVIWLGGFYYLVQIETSSTQIVILKSPLLSDFREAEKKIVYTASENSTLCCAKLHLIDGQLYIYFPMTIPTTLRRPFVIAAESRDNPMGNWSSPKPLLGNLWEMPSGQSSVLTMNDRLYFVWATTIPKDDESSQVIVNIAQMQNPGEVVAPVVLLRQPTQTWECFGTCIIDTPSFIYNGGIAFMVFSASSSVDVRSSLSYMSIETHKNPLDISNWASADGPVFQQNVAEEVFAPFTPCFTTSPDETETWMIYHASTNASNVGGTINIRIDKIEWNPVDGSPIFSKPHGINNAQPVPSYRAG